MKYTQITPDITENYLEELLLARGIKDINGFINPSKDSELQGAKLTNMANATIMLHKNIDKKIGLLVDSDCDGFTSAAIMYQYLHDVNPNVDITYYLHEGKGHGLDDMKDVIDEDLDGTNGEIIRLDKQGIYVKCQSGTIVLTKLKPEGKGIMNASDLINGRKVSLGEILG